MTAPAQEMAQAGLGVPGQRVASDASQTPADFGAWLLGSWKGYVIEQSTIAEALHQYNAECATMAPEKDVAGLLPSSEGAVTYLRPAAGLHAWQSWELCSPDDENGRPVYFAAPGAAIAAREQEAPKTLSKKDLNKLLNDFAQACAFGDVLERMSTSKAIHEYLDAAFATFASRHEAPVASGEPTDAQLASMVEAAGGDAWQEGATGSMAGDHVFKMTPDTLRKLLASPSGAGLGGAASTPELLEAAEEPMGHVGSRTLESSIAELDAWLERSDGEPMLPSEGESLFLVLHELKLLRATHPTKGFQ